MIRRLLVPDHACAKGVLLEAPDSGGGGHPPHRDPIDEGVARPDDDVARLFCDRVRRDHLDIPSAQAHVAMHFYGLLCADISSQDAEVLFPSTQGMAHTHEPRMYSAAPSSGLAGKPVPDATNLFYWDLSGKSVTFTPAGAHQRPQKLARRERHPWLSMDNVVRDLSAHTGRQLISDRNNTARVACRVPLEGGYITPGSPLSGAGCMVEWTRANAEPAATTDNFLHVRKLDSGTTRFRVTLRPLAGGQAQDVEFELLNDQLVLAFTHAVTAHGGSTPALEHTKAFANLMEGMRPNDYVVPAFARTVHGHSTFDAVRTAKLSGSDPHCECAFCP